MLISFTYLLICTLPYVYSFELQQTAIRTYSKMHMLSESEEPIEMNRIPPRYKKQEIRKAQWFPLLKLNAPEMLDMNETTIRVSLSRARKTIREKLTQTHNYGIK